MLFIYLLRHWAIENTMPNSFFTITVPSKLQSHHKRLPRRRRRLRLRLRKYRNFGAAIVHNPHILPSFNRSINKVNISYISGFVPLFMGSPYGCFLTWKTSINCGRLNEPSVRARSRRFSYKQEKILFSISVSNTLH